MKYGYTIVYVEDVLATLEFYEKAFGFERGMVYEEAGVVDYAELKSGETTLGFASHTTLGEMNFAGKYQKISPKGGPVGLELVFVDDDVESATNHAVKSGAEACSRANREALGSSSQLRALH